MSYIELPALFYKSPVSSSSALPGSPQTGEVRLVLDTGILYWYNGSSWQLIPTSFGATSVSDTNSIDLTVLAGVLSADVRLSANAADATYQAVALNTESTSSVGLRAQIADSSIRGRLSGTAPVSYNSGTGAISMAAASGSVDGYLTSGNWTTFNNKEPAISAGTASQYWRGDKSFQTLQVSALTARTDGGAASAGAIGEILTASQTSNTSTNVAATGVWGYATSVSLTAGVWQLSGVAGFSENGATLTTALECGISSTTNAAAIGDFDRTISPFQLSSTSDALLATPVIYISISSTTTYYLNTKFYYSAGNPQHRGKIQALRIR